MSDKIQLSDMIQTLKLELEKAQANSVNSNLKFSVDAVELELSVEVSKTGGGNAEVKFWVIGAGGKYEQEDIATHKFKLTLKPSGPGGSIEVANTSDKKPSNK